MQTRLMDDPVWLDPDESLSRLAGHRLLIVTPSGAMVKVFISIILSESGPLQYAVKITNGRPRYLTAEAVRMIHPSEAGHDPELMLSFAV